MRKQMDMKKEFQLVMPLVLPTEMNLDYHWEMTMGSQMDMKKEYQLVLPTEMHLNFHWEMTMGS